MKNDIEYQYDELNTEDPSFYLASQNNNADELCEILKQCYYTFLFIIILASGIVLIIYLLTIIIT